MKIKITRHGEDMYIREFGPKVSDPNFVVDPPRHYYEAVHEPNEGTNFTGDEAMKRAKRLALVHHGELVDP